MKTINSSNLAGISGKRVLVECEISKGIGISLGGMVDSDVKKSLLRVVTVLQANCVYIPDKKIVINLAPADLTKRGCGYDLPIALAFLAESGQTGPVEGANLDELGSWMAVGGLDFDGSVRWVDGVIQAVQTAIEYQCKGVIIPRDNAMEVAANFAEIIPVYAVSSLKEAISVIGGVGDKKTVWDEWRENAQPALARNKRWDYIVGNPAALRALEIAAAGGHGLLMIGAPSSGKASLARALLDILPGLSAEEAMEVAAVYSAAGKGAFRPANGEQGLRPFRAPNGTCSVQAMFGGGINVLPGEISLAHNGILYLGEVNDMPKSIMESIGYHFKDGDGHITIPRLKGNVTYPAKAMLVAASNPCPCGWHGEVERCTCTPGQKSAYLNRIISNKLYQCFDIQVWTHTPVPGAPKVKLSADEVRSKVISARERQLKRFRKAGLPITLNGEMGARDIELVCHLNDETAAFLDNIIDRLGLSGFAASSILKLARTIADIEGDDDIKPAYIAEASSYRFLDKRDLTSSISNQKF